MSLKVPLSKLLFYSALLAAAGPLQGQDPYVYSSLCDFGPGYCYEISFGQLNYNFTAIYFDFSYADSTYLEFPVKTQPSGYYAGSINLTDFLGPPLPPGWTLTPNATSRADIELKATDPSAYFVNGGILFFNSPYAPINDIYSGRICVEWVGYAPSTPCIDSQGRMLHGTTVRGPVLPGAPVTATPEPAYGLSLTVGLGMMVLIGRKRRPCRQDSEQP